LGLTDHQTAVTIPAGDNRLMARVRHVNTTSLSAAISLGCRTMGQVFNADDDGIPFFGSELRPNPRLSFSSVHSEAHVPGRHLNALLNAEDVLGVPVPDEVIQQHTRAAFFSYSGPVPLPLNRNELGGPLVNFCPHNVREGFHALYALARYRKSREARELAEASIAAIGDLWHPDTGWDQAALRALGLQDQSWGGSFIVGLARAIGPLVKYYRATSYGPALELALVLKDKAFTEFLLPEGTYSPATFGTHVHSTTCVMSGLAQLADLLQDMPLLLRVKAFYDHGLTELRDDLGWSLENAGPQANPDLGECNNTGDILETALILGRHGFAEYYQDAERILRGHLLPAQLRDAAFVVQPDNPGGEDGLRDLADRHLGAFGFPAPYGHLPVDCHHLSFNMDIVGGAVGSLCEALREVARSDAGGHRVNLLFDHDTPDVKLTSPYAGGKLQVTVRTPGALWVRLPSWVDLTRLEVEHPDRPPRLVDRHLYLPRPPLHQPLTIRFPLTEQDLVLHHRPRDIRVRLRGDEVIAMDNFGMDLTYFDPY
jgi:hypothetical protein